MGAFSDAATLKEGLPLVEQASGFALQIQKITAMTSQLGTDYEGFRNLLDSDADDVALANSRLAEEVKVAKLRLDDMPALERRWVDSFITGLGYTKNS